MAKIESEILEIINKFILELNNKGFNVSDAYLFGSYASGRQDEWSDIDVGIVSDKFEGKRFSDKQKLRGLFRNIDTRLSPYPIIKEDLNDDPFVVQEIVQNGIKIL